MSRSDFRSRYPTFAKISVKIVAGITCFVGNYTFVFGFLWSFMSNFFIVIDLVLSNFLMSTTSLFDHWNPTSCTNSVYFQRSTSLYLYAFLLMNISNVDFHSHILFRIHTSKTITFVSRNDDLIPFLTSC